MPKFVTIRQAAATGLLSEHRLRIMVAEGKCPGIRSGNRFLVNLDALAELLDSESQSNCEVAERASGRFVATEGEVELMMRLRELPREMKLAINKIVNEAYKIYYKEG